MQNKLVSKLPKHSKFKFNLENLSKKVHNLLNLNLIKEKPRIRSVEANRDLNYRPRLLFICSQLILFLR